MTFMGPQRSGDLMQFLKSFVYLIGFLVSAAISRDHQDLFQ